jgi:DNA segregation ATPase FtsK/SpoIIIE, S-DNA-T family
MTQVATDTVLETTAARDVQRESLERIVKLSIECTAQEQRVEQQHTETLEKENAEFHKTITVVEGRRQRRQMELRNVAQKRKEEIQNRYQTRRAQLEEAYQTVQRQLARTREETESTLKTQFEQAKWQAESTLVQLEMKVDADEQHAKQEQEASTTELKGLTALETAAKEALTRYRMEAPAVDAAVDEALKKRLAADRLAVLGEYRPQAAGLLAELQKLTEIRALDDLMPLFLILAGAAVCGAAGWIVPAEEHTKLLAAGIAGGAAVVVGAAVFVFYRMRIRAKTRARARAVYVSFRQALQMANQAARFDAEAAAAARDRRVAEARDQCGQETTAAREKGKAAQLQAAERYRTALAEETQRHTEHMAAVEQAKETDLEETARNRETRTRQYEQEDTQARAAEEVRHKQALEALEGEYETQWRQLAARWEQGLRAVTELMAAGGGIDPHLVDWNNAAWERWQSPAEFAGQIRFGEMKVDLAELTAQVPQRLKLPESFSVPALLTLPTHASLLVEADHTGREAAIDLAQLVMARLLTQIPAGRVKFTLFDPVGLGQSFAGFMHLADHDESLVGSRIWTEKEHMQQRLADLTEHMETVIQKYLRNEYATIDQYNAQAGELAEPLRFLVIADFPTEFEPETLRRLASIVTTGPRCGVYTIILRDTRQSLPPGSRMEEIVTTSVRLVYRNGGFTWEDAVFKRFPLRVDASPDERTLTRLMEQVGKAAKIAKRVEVPFQSIAPREQEMWSASSKEMLRVPIGKSGATRLQALRLGVGVAQHALVAGKTGSGKSNLMHTIVTNLALWYAPEEVEFYLVDFKKGVEFKAYVASCLPHARAIAVESDREFGLSVLQRVDAELTRRGALFRDTGVQEISAYRDRTGQKLPRCLLLIDEFQEFFSEDDKLGQEAAGLLDRLVRQGRAFGVHLILGSQTIGGGSGLGRSTLGQITVRVALQCTEADSQMILGDNNSAARLLSRPGEAVYNDAGGSVEANSPFQIAFLPDEQREKHLRRVREMTQARGVEMAPAIVFEGNSAAEIHHNQRLMALLRRHDYPAAASVVPAYVGEPVAIKEPSSIPLRRQSGVNVLLIGQQEESAIAIFSSLAASIAAQHKPGEAQFYLLDGSPADSRYFGLLEKVLAALPHPSKVIAWRQVPEAIHELAMMAAHRRDEDEHAGPAVFLLLFGLQRYRLLRRQEDDFSFSRGEEAAAPKPDRQFAELLTEGPALGLHSIIWADTPITLERTLERSSMRQFDHRILFQMSAADSSNLIDSPLANRLGAHRALLYSEEQGTVEKFRPYEVPDEAWLAFLAEQFKTRTA